MSSAIVCDIIKWMYMHDIENAGEKVEDLLAAADYLQVAGLKEMCGRMLIETISADNCLQLLNTAFKYDVKNLKNPCVVVFLNNKTKVLAKTKHLANTVSHVSPSGLEMLGIELEKKNSWNKWECQPE